MVSTYIWGRGALDHHSPPARWPWPTGTWLIPLPIFLPASPAGPCQPGTREARSARGGVAMSVPFLIKQGVFFPHPFSRSTHLACITSWFELWRACFQVRPVGCGPRNQPCPSIQSGAFPLVITQPCRVCCWLWSKTAAEVQPQRGQGIQAFLQGPIWPGTLEWLPPPSFPTVCCGTLVKIESKGYELECGTTAAWDGE